jgi:hypothetical protein
MVQSCPETEDGVHVPLTESVSAEHKARLSDSIVVKVLCTACGARGEVAVLMSHLVWTPPLRSLMPDEN